MKIAAALFSLALASCVASDDDLDLAFTGDTDELTSSPWRMTATVTPGYDRHFTWDMQVTPPVDVALAPDEIRVETVNVEVWNTGVQRSRFAIEGQVDVTNAGARTETFGYADVWAGGGQVTVTCPAPLPVKVAAGATVTCRYYRVLDAERPGTVWFLIGGSGGSASSSLPYRFDGPVRTTDWDRFVEIVAEEHIHGMHVDFVDAGSTPRWTTSYQREVGPFPACEAFTAPDTVTLNAHLGLGSFPSGRVWFTRDATVHGQVSCPAPEPTPEI
jgi:hypothetical protein